RWSTFWLLAYCFSSGSPRRRSERPPLLAALRQLVDDPAGAVDLARNRQREADVGPRLAERPLDVVDDEREDEEVERVERPAEEPGEDRVALVGVLRGRHFRCRSDVSRGHRSCGSYPQILRAARGDCAASRLQAKRPATARSDGRS